MLTFGEATRGFMRTTLSTADSRKKSPHYSRKVELRLRGTASAFFDDDNQRDRGDNGLMRGPANRTVNGDTE